MIETIYLLFLFRTKPAFRILKKHILIVVNLTYELDTVVMYVNNKYEVTRETRQIQLKLALFHACDVYSTDVSCPCRNVHYQDVPRDNCASYLRRHNNHHRRRNQELLFDWMTIFASRQVSGAILRLV